MPILEPGQKEVTAHWYDETIFQAGDRRMTRWVCDGEMAGLYKKGEGLLLMVADFVSAKYGWLQHPLDGDDKDTARVVFCPGKERDGYFSNQNVCTQLEQALKVVTEEYPNKEHVFIFNNATTHTKPPNNAPVASKMTLGPSLKVGGETTGLAGEKPKVKFTPGRFADGSPQEFYYPVNHPKKELWGAFKGLDQILEEQGVPGA